MTAPFKCLDIEHYRNLLVMFGCEVLSFEFHASLPPLS